MALFSNIKKNPYKSRSPQLLEQIIVVKHGNLQLRDKFIERRKVIRDLSIDNSVLSSKDRQSVYLRKALSSSNIKIYAVALGLRRHKIIKYLWIVRGKFFSRKADGFPPIDMDIQQTIEGLR